MILLQRSEMRVVILCFSRVSTLFDMGNAGFAIIYAITLAINNFVLKGHPFHPDRNVFSRKIENATE